jgi:hypothetical protein
MIQNKFGEMIFSESDVCDLIMQGCNLSILNNMIVDHTVDLSTMSCVLDPVPELVLHQVRDCTVQDWHAKNQTVWHMPDQYKNLDIAEHVLKLCNTDAELQRCGQELLLYQERDLFPLLQYLAYLVDVMKTNHVIWGVGRGSSVASYVLYKLGVHRIDSLFYDLSIDEFLR